MPSLREHLFSPHPASRPRRTRGVRAWAQRWQEDDRQAGYTLHATRADALAERDAQVAFWQRWVEPELEVPLPRQPLGDPFVVRIDPATARDVAARGSIQRAGYILPAH